MYRTIRGTCWYGSFNSVYFVCLQVVVVQNNVHIFMDPQDTGEWADCVVVENMNLSPQWAVKLVVY